MSERSFFDEYETKEQYEHLEGQNGMDIYTLQSFLSITPIIFYSVIATSVASDAFLGMTR